MALTPTLHRPGRYRFRFCIRRPTKQVESVGELMLPASILISLTSYPVYDLCAEPRRMLGESRSRQPPSFDLTTSLTVRPSAFFPASAACTDFITLPMSFMELAPVSATAAVTTTSISSREAAC